MKENKAADLYDSSSIEVLSGLEPVFKRPGMYTDTSSPNHLAQEVIDNSVDEALVGQAKEIKVEIKADGSMIVTDDGRGMPIDIHPQHKISGVELILTRLHSGAKFSNKTYKFSGGLHGVGVSVVNALSSNFLVEVWKEGEKHEMQFNNGVKKGNLKKAGSTATDKKRGHGTRISFKPNSEYFDSNEFSLQHIRRIVRSKAVLCPGLRTILIDKRKASSPVEEEWLYEDGVAEYIMSGIHRDANGEDEKAKGKGNGKDKEETYLLPATPWVYETEVDGKELLCGIIWNLDEETSNLVRESYVNLIPTIADGTHVTSFRTGIFEAVRDFCEQRNLLNKAPRLTSDDVWAYCNYLLAIKIQNPHFAGQTKEKLSSEQQTSFISGKIRTEFGNWLNSFSSQGEKLAQLALSNAQERVRRAEQAKKKKKGLGKLLPGKLASCSSNKPEECELFLVEGDSAGGSAKQARDKKTQAVLPLRGKILNTWELSEARIVESQEVQNIIRAIGVMPNSDTEDLRYHKICILADADSDGMHIASLLCGLFVKHFPNLVKENRIYIAMPPLYRIDQGKQVFYALDDNERDEVVAKLKKNAGQISIQRFKGLGEMNTSQLKETTMAPATRRLVSLQLNEYEGQEKQLIQKLNVLFSKKSVEERRQFLEERGKLAQIA